MKRIVTFLLGLTLLLHLCACGTASSGEKDELRPLSQKTPRRPPLAKRLQAKKKPLSHR